MTNLPDEAPARPKSRSDPGSQETKIVLSRGGAAMNIRWVRIKGVFECAKVNMGATKQETYFWNDGRRIFAIKSTGRV